MGAVVLTCVMACPHVNNVLCVAKRCSLIKVIEVKSWATVGAFACDAQQPMPTHTCISMVPQSTYATYAMMCHVKSAKNHFRTRTTPSTVAINTGTRNNSGTL